MMSYSGDVLARQNTDKYGKMKYSEEVLARQNTDKYSKMKYSEDVLVRQNTSSSQCYQSLMSSGERGAVGLPEEEEEEEEEVGGGCCCPQEHQLDAKDAEVEVEDRQFPTRLSSTYSSICGQHGYIAWQFARWGRTGCRRPRPRASATSGRSSRGTGSTWSSCSSSTHCRLISSFRFASFRSFLWPGLSVNLFVMYLE